MKIIITCLLLIITHSLNCNLYDYSKPKISCVQACPSGTTQIESSCLASNQYYLNSQVFVCRGVVSLDRSSCCKEKEYV